MNNGTDRKPVVSSFKFLFHNRDIPDHNIVNYTLAQIRRGKINDVYNQLKAQIHGIGPKLASLWLRDVVLIWELEQHMSYNDLFCCQPIDIYVSRRYLKIIIDACKEEKTSPLLLNAGAWMAGYEINI
jgi:hypothetical protein